MTQEFGFRSVVVMLNFMAAGTAGFAQDGKNLEARARTEITIRVYNYADLQLQTITQTKVAITRILNLAGIMPRWIDCDSSSNEPESHSACQERMLPSELAILIFHKFRLPSGVSRDSHLASAEVFPNGQAGHYVRLSYDHIRESAGGFCPPETLAEVAVHEIGHVLFRSTGHSPTGLMRARWDRQDIQNAAIGNSRFTPQQAEILRAEVAACMKLARAEADPAGNIGGARGRNPRRW
jgi:hypothetical protein